MKTTLLLPVAAAISLLASPAFSQVITNPPPPYSEVNVGSPDRYASEPGLLAVVDHAVFTITRDRGTDPLRVFYSLSGTASNGLDYQQLPQSVVIPSNALAVKVYVAPKPDDLVEGTETVELTLVPSPIMSPLPTYVVGPDSKMVVFISDQPTNPPPPVTSVSITAIDAVGSEIPEVPPGLGMPQAFDPAVFQVRRIGPTNLPLAVIYEVGGTASNGVDYASLPGQVTIPAGSLAANIVVEVIDDLLAEGPEQVQIMLKPVPCLPGTTSTTCYVLGSPADAAATILDNDQITNHPPVVRITSPPNNSVFRAPINLPLFAYARDPEDAVESVEFYDENLSLGLASLVGPPPANSSVVPTNQYVLVWSNAPIGLHALRAKALDTRGTIAWSMPVRVTITNAPPPPTNRPVLVSIVAADPVAIEGTNCWVWPGVTNRPPPWSNLTLTACAPITNCGPKNAAFAVRRHGATNDAIEVAYLVHGSASNGVDYVTLPGTVTIPAGERMALIPVVPIPDDLREPIETVIVRLKPVTNLPPAYLPGEPRQAAAIIAENFGPRPATAVLADKCFHLNASGPDGAWFAVEYSKDLRNWVRLCTSQVVNGTIDFVDPEASTAPSRVYRAVPLEQGPSE
jgi:hypothetical protein